MHTLIVLLLAAPVLAQTVNEKEPTPKARGRYYWSKTATGFHYVWRVPKDYKPEQGADLIVYAANGGRNVRGLVAHVEEELENRRDAIILAPWWFPSLGEEPAKPHPEASRQLHMVLQHMRSTFKVTGTWGIGKSEGASFLAFHAGIRQGDFDGFVALQPHTWKEIKVSKTGKRDTAVALFARTDSSVNENQLAYVETLFDAYRENGYKHVHLGVWHHTAAYQEVAGRQLLAWCRGVKTTDPARLAEAYDTFRGIAPQARDLAALYSLAQHIALTGAALKTRAERCMAAIDRLAGKHVAALGKSGARAYAARPWLGHIPAFLESFRGVPAREQFEGEWRALRLEHVLAAAPHLAMYEAQRYHDIIKAFNAGVVAIHRGFLDPRCYSTPLHDHLERFRKSGNPRFEKRDLRFWEAHKKAHADGVRVFLKLNSGFKVP